MLDFFDELILRNKFIETDFNTSPFQFLSIKGINLGSLIESFLQKIKEKPQNNFENERTITFTYQKENYFIFKNPINFKFFYDNNIFLKYIMILN